MDFTLFDHVLMGLAGVLVVIGLFRGLSGGIGTLAGTGAGVAAGFLIWDLCGAAVLACPWVSAPLAVPVTAILDFVLSLIAFGIVRRLVARFVSFLIPQPLNALLGALVGLALGTLVTFLLAATAVFEGGALTEGFIASHSRLVCSAAACIESRRGAPDGE